VTIHDELSEFVTRIAAAAAANLECVLLYGSAARDEHDEKFSDVNLLCVLRDAAGTALDVVAPVVAWWTEQGHRPPMVLALAELAESADVFAIETLDLKNAHRVLYGRDVVSALEIPMNLHRVQLEHDLRTLLLRLRQHYLLAAAQDDSLKQVLAKSVSTTITLLRHALIAVGQEGPADSHGVIAAAEKAFSVNASSVSAALDLREQRRVEGETRLLYRSYMECVARVIQQVDRVAPKSDWQRVSGKTK
jgi:predicted nucleotidyltransferase